VRRYGALSPGTSYAFQVPVPGTGSDPRAPAHRLPAGLLPPRAGVVRRSRPTRGLGLPACLPDAGGMGRGPQGV